MNRFFTLALPFFATLTALVTTSCVTDGPFPGRGGRSYHQPEIAVAMPSDPNEREIRYSGDVAETLRRAGYIPVFPDSGLPARYQLDLNVDRTGPIAIYSLIKLTDERDTTVAKGESTKPAVARLINGESAYDDVFYQSLSQFQKNLPPAQRPSYQRNDYQNQGGYQRDPYQRNPGYQQNSYHNNGNYRAQPYRY